jgi:hypothetical protein
MATPHVSGAAALILAACGDQTVTALKSTILNNVDPLASLSISPSSKRVGSGGGNVTYTVTIVQTGGFTGNVAFTATGPTGITYEFNSNPVSTSSGNSSVLTVTVASTTPAGNYPFTVTGTSGSLSHQASATLVKGKGKK